MANRTYLIYLDSEDLDVANEGFEGHGDILAEAPYCLPLFWIALFRPENIRRMDYPDPDTGMILRSERPVVLASVAAQQIVDALPFLNRLFVDEGPVDDYIALLKQVMEEATRPYVTLYLDELAWMYDPDTYFDNFRQALTDMVTENISTEAKIRWKNKMAEIEGDRPFPPARMFVDPTLQTDNPEDEAIHLRLLGCQWSEYPTVPWEAT